MAEKDNKSIFNSSLNMDLKKDENNNHIDNDAPASLSISY